MLGSPFLFHIILLSRGILFHILMLFWTDIPISFLSFMKNFLPLIAFKDLVLDEIDLLKFFFFFQRSLIIELIWWPNLLGSDNRELLDCFILCYFCNCSVACSWNLLFNPKKMAYYSSGIKLSRINEIKIPVN